MEVSIQRKPAFTVAGIKLEGIDASQCPRVWEKLFGSVSPEKLVQMGNGQSYGACFDAMGSTGLNYMACYDTNDQKAAAEAGLEVVSIPENDYAVVKLQGAVPGCIQQGWQYAMGVFFPERGYRHSGAPDFEVYGTGDMSAPAYRMELWIPVVKSADKQEA